MVACGGRLLAVVSHVSAVRAAPCIWHGCRVDGDAGAAAAAAAGERGVWMRAAADRAAGRGGGALLWRAERHINVCGGVFWVGMRAGGGGLCGAARLVDGAERSSERCCWRGRGAAHCAFDSEQPGYRRGRRVCGAARARVVGRWWTGTWASWRSGGSRCHR